MIKKNTKNQIIYQGWLIPTKLCITDFPRKIGKEGTLTEVQESLYFHKIDEPAPDKELYYQWRVFPAEQT